jgi:hypothetical protein
MKTLKVITGIALMAIFSLTSCQSEVDDVQGENPNTNSSESTTANSLKRTSMYDGSSDDFLDGSSCTSILFPAVVTVNGIQVSLLSQLDYEQAISILGQINDNEDTVELHFPLRIRMSDYTEVTVNNQTEYDTIINECKEAEDSDHDAISTIGIQFPITILTYDLSLEQTGSIVITSKRELFTYISHVSNTELFSIQYPIKVTLRDGTEETVNSDAEFRTYIEAAIKLRAQVREAELNARKLVHILLESRFRVHAFVRDGVDSATNYIGYGVYFVNDWKLKAINTLGNTATGTYKVNSELNVFLRLNFTNDASTNNSFSLLNDTWKVTSFSTSSITLQSTTNAAVSLVLKQVI